MTHIVHRNYKFLADAAAHFAAQGIGTRVWYNECAQQAHLLFVGREDYEELAEALITYSYQWVKEEEMNAQKAKEVEQQRVDALSLLQQYRSIVGKLHDNVRVLLNEQYGTSEYFEAAHDYDSEADILSQIDPLAPRYSPHY